MNTPSEAIVFVGATIAARAVPVERTGSLYKALFLFVIDGFARAFPKRGRWARAWGIGLRS